MHVQPKPSVQLLSELTKLEPVVEKQMRLQGMQLLSCHNNAKTWLQLLPGHWQAKTVDGWAVLSRPIWHEAFGQWLTHVPHVWVELRDQGRTVILDGSVAQFKGQIPSYVKVL